MNDIHKNTGRLKWQMSKETKVLEINPQNNAYKHIDFR